MIATAAQLSRTDKRRPWSLKRSYIAARDWSHGIAHWCHTRQDTGLHTCTAHRQATARTPSLIRIGGGSCRTDCHSSQADTGTSRHHWTPDTQRWHRKVMVRRGRQLLQLARLEGRNIVWGGDPDFRKVCLVSKCLVKLSAEKH